MKGIELWTLSEEIELVTMIGEAGAKERKADSQCKYVVLQFIRRISVQCSE